MSQLVIVVNVPDHNESEVTDYIGVAHEVVRLVKLQHPFDDGISVAGVALGDEDTVHEHYWKP